MIPNQKELELRKSLVEFIESKTALYRDQDTNVLKKEYDSRALRTVKIISTTDFGCQRLNVYNLIKEIAPFELPPLFLDNGLFPVYEAGVAVTPLSSDLLNGRNSSNYTIGYAAVSRGSSGNLWMLGAHNYGGSLPEMRADEYIDERKSVIRYSTKEEIQQFVDYIIPNDLEEFAVSIGYNNS